MLGVQIGGRFYPCWCLRRDSHARSMIYGTMKAAVASISVKLDYNVQAFIKMFASPELTHKDHQNGARGGGGSLSVSDEYSPQL